METLDPKEWIKLSGEEIRVLLALIDERRLKTESLDERRILSGLWIGLREL